MGEAEWLACDDPREMLLRLRSWAVSGAAVPGKYDPLYKVTTRQLILWVQACQSGVHGGQWGASMLEIARSRARLHSELDAWSRGVAHSEECPLALRAALWREIIGNPFRQGVRRVPIAGGQYRWKKRDGGLVRSGDLEAGCPFTQLLDVWVTPDVLGLAQSIYDEWKPWEMFVLADALEDAGCDSEALLRHLRGEELTRGKLSDSWFWRKLPTPHVRGCWALDLVLGRE